MKLMLRKKQALDNRNGFVSIIIAGVIMIILTLITLGFTRIMQREQQQALDRQLSRQALYAAEAGINDFYKSISTNQNLPYEKNDCDLTSTLTGLDGNPVSNPAISSGALSADSNVAYTCALYDKTPQELQYDLSVDKSEITELKTETGNNFLSITFQWGADDVSTQNVGALPACGDTALQATKGNIPGLRIDLTNTAGAINRDNLVNSTESMYVLPCNNSSGGTGNYTIGDADARIKMVPCTVSGNQPCRLIITGGLSSNTYLMRVKALYSSANLTITGSNNNAVGVATPVEFVGAQTNIDVTAKAGDVIRRLRASVPVFDVQSAPDAAFQSISGICKQVSVIRHTDGRADPYDVADACP